MRRAPVQFDVEWMGPVLKFHTDTGDSSSELKGGPYLFDGCHVPPPRPEPGRFRQRSCEPGVRV